MHNRPLRATILLRHVGVLTFKSFSFIINTNIINNVGRTESYGEQTSNKRCQCEAGCI
jgi:hypothetical protein